MSEPSNFDAASAQHFNRRPGGSCHHAYTDAAGSVCLWCRGRSPRGGVAVSLSALDWLRERDGSKFVRLTNPARDLDEIISLDELPEKDTREGPGGSYVFIDPEDLHGPDFAPVGDDIPF